MAPRLVDRRARRPAIFLAAAVTLARSGKPVTNARLSMGANRARRGRARASFFPLDRDRGGGVGAHWSGKFDEPARAPAPRDQTDTGAPIQGRAKIIDGNSLEVAGERIRLFGIDAPEGKQDCRDANGLGYSCGREAARILTALIGGRPVTCTRVTHDQYERDVATCVARGPRPRRGDGARRPCAGLSAPQPRPLRRGRAQRARGQARAIGRDSSRTRPTGGKREMRSGFLRSAPRREGAAKRPRLPGAVCFTGSRGFSRA